MPRWHSSSTFGPGPRRPLDRDARERVRYLLHAHHRARRLTRAARDVGLALLRRLSVDGRCDPSHATLAGDAACSERTVRRAAAAMRGLGLLRWVSRLVRDAASGWRCAQASNSYQLMSSADQPAARVCCDGQKDRAIRRIEITSAVEVAAARAALARRAAVVEKTLRELGGALRGRAT